ncbi:hypothetical protein DYD21_00105 [Rhodohalobacter sp. SW132]|uniref:alpha/beta hydrolase n=1 Tax=Rhodohalobacter sp. SW132 TaxID=2293433 RepID=UPI000E273824|nr:alpha/beta-hydrolase family protein [Rhodohalobacter sp. SW132]REL38396.1 hypothetical protein DYD21_00105 [Rhodohalobacter sp. SW132]
MIFKRYFSTSGLLVGTFFFALSMTPSLLPRTDFYQGLVSGLSMAAGYGIGVLFIWLYTYFQMPQPKQKTQKKLQITAAVISILTAVIFLWRANGWQNSIRELMQMEETASGQPLIIGAIALMVFLAVIMIARAIRWTFRFVTRKIELILPQRVSMVIGLIISFFLFWSIVDGVLFSSILHTADSTYEQVDSLIEPEVEKPDDPMKVGSLASLLSWEDMGRTGRSFLFRTPSAEEIQSFTNQPVMEPIRVYVGMHTAESVEERAALALQEMIRVNAFEREILVIITPTGTGWVDPASISTLEFLHRGNVASIAAQYSYLPSPLSLMFRDEYGVEMAQGLFNEVYNYWKSLPADTRPRLYLHGLSLGALNSDRSFDLFDIIDDPFHGALWVGPPFRKTTWRTTTDRRNPGSPAWLPEFRDGSVVRFANQNGGLHNAEAEWGSFRIAYLQYASDPITFFEPRSFSRAPAWMNEPRGPDVSEQLRWFPVVTMVQLAVDMLLGTEPTGYGHEYAAEHYFDSWYALTEPEGWSREELEELRRYFEESNR